MDGTGDIGGNIRRGSVTLPHDDLVRGHESNTFRPCGACRTLRRKCVPECLFAPHFPYHEPERFVAVHKVFGASNAWRMLLNVPEGQRAEAANSLIYEANLRLSNPVHGCVGEISALQLQVRALKAQLQEANAELFRYRFGEFSNNMAFPPHDGTIPSGAASIDLPSPALFPALTPPPPPLMASPPAPSVTSPLSSSSATVIYTPPNDPFGHGSTSSFSLPYFE